MIIIGVTGSIGMGKTTIARMLGQFGMPVFDSDSEVKDILENNDEVKSQICEIWPNVLIKKNNRKEIDKSFFNIV